MKKVILTAILFLLFISLSINLKAEDKNTSNPEIKGLDAIQGIWKYKDENTHATLTVSGNDIRFSCFKNIEGIDSEYLSFNGTIVSARDDKWKSKECKIFEWKGLRKRRGFDYDKAIVSDDMGGFVIIYPGGTKGVYIHEIDLFMTP